MRIWARSALLVAAIAITAARTAFAAPAIFHSSAGDLKVETVAGGLVHPWSLAFLPDGRMLVTERPGRMRIVTDDGKLSSVAGVPKVFARGQAGLLDVAIDRDYANNATIYFCYNANSSNVAVARARLSADEKPRLDDLTIIFRQKGPASPGSLNVACRIAQARDGNLFVSLGDHFMASNAQSLSDDIGKIVRIRPDGSVPPGNPFAGKAGARPEIWSYGHRNAEGLAFNPADGKLWEQEHGPMGGDEINIIEKGKNYGWPLVSYGVNYDGTPVGHGKTHQAGTVQPVWHWTPSIAPSGMAFYNGKLFPAWRGSLFNGALKFQLLSRLALDGDKVLKEERLLHGLRERIRDVREGPDGAIYLLTDNSKGRILRIVPAK